MSIKSEFFVVGLNFALLIYAALNLSVGYQEAVIFFGSGFLSEFANLGFTLAPQFARIQPDFTLRAPFVVLHFINVFLLYKIAEFTLPRRSDRLIATSVYMFLPGVLASAVLVNLSGFIILISLLSVYFVEKGAKPALVAILCASVFLGHNFLSLYAALLLYGIYRKDRFYQAIGAIFLIVWTICFDFDFGGKPKGYAIDMFGIFAAVFSPLIFTYFIYAAYRIWVKESKDFLWFVSVSTFGICVLLSIRQKLQLEMFLPYCAIFVPHMVRVFFASYRVRLPEFRLKYKILGVILIASLVPFSLSSVFYDYFYAFLSKPHKHFAYNYSIARELSHELKSRGINAVDTDIFMQKRLKFYGINSGGEYFLESANSKVNSDTIAIRKFDKNVAEFSLYRKENLSKFD